MDAMALFGRHTPQDDAQARAWRDWLARRHPLAIASLVVGLFSLTHLGTLIVDAVAGMVLGAMALRSLAAAGPTPEGRIHGHRLAWAGILTSGMSLAIAVVLYTWPRAH